MAWSLITRDVSSLQEKEHGMVDVPPPPVTASWKKGSASGDPSAECVEVLGTQEHVWVRDSKNPLGPALGFTREGWSAFVVGIQRDEFDHSWAPA